MQRLKQGDEIVVITGKDKGRRGEIRSVNPDGKVIVDGINVVKKHQRGNPNAGVEGGIITKEMPMQSSNVMLFNEKAGKGDRVGFKTLENGRKVRYFKSNGEQLDK